MLIMLFVYAIVIAIILQLVIIVVFVFVHILIRISFFNTTVRENSSILIVIYRETNHKDIIKLIN